MTQPPDPQQPQWWQPPAHPPAGWQEQQATGPHAGQWQQNADPGTASGSYTGQWTPSQQPGGSGSFSGPWQPGQPGSGPWQQPGTPGGGQAAQFPPPAQQQQYGGGFQPAQYGGLGAFAGKPEKKPKSKKPALIAGAVVLVLVVGGVAAWLLGAFRGNVLEQQSLQDGVVKVLNESYGEPDVTNAQCPANEAAENGTTFDCTVKIGGQDKKVTIRVLNDRPEYEVGAPH
ncbi:DUF4333 domain-containing protein [Amycolatopsis sp. NPDC101161]|uniref:DUF4333 domain-containing protein n=1 Tax=Amycolatopsis sp. NPDC101161 TaxID=3363940 RepID=UPI003801FB94